MGAVAAAAVVPIPVDPAVAEVVPGDGIATHYDSVDGGNCSFTGPPADHLDVALDEAEYGTADACGAYVDVVGPSGTVRVKVTNRCPECPLHHLDLSKTAFARIAALEAGQVPISYTLVRNPPVAEPITLRVKSGSSRWWLQIQADDHGNPLASFELRTGDGWRPLVHTQDNFWMAENPGPGDGPFTVRITDIYGQSVTIDDVGLAVDQVQRTDARLYGSGTPAPPPPPPPSTTTTAAPPTTTTAVPTTTTTAPATTTTSSTTTAAPDDEVERVVATAESRPIGPSALALAGLTFAVAAGAAVVLRRRSDGGQGGGDSAAQP